jgi:hypothetical protein
LVRLSPAGSPRRIVSAACRPAFLAQSESDHRSGLPNAIVGEHNPLVIDRLSRGVAGDLAVRFETDRRDPGVNPVRTEIRHRRKDRMGFVATQGISQSPIMPKKPCYNAPCLHGLDLQSYENGKTVYRKSPSGRGCQSLRDSADSR